MQNLDNGQSLNPAGMRFDGGIEGGEGGGEDDKEDSGPKEGIDGIVDEEVLVIHSGSMDRVHCTL